MEKLARYYISRSVIAAAFGLFFYISGIPWWAALLATALLVALFLWMPHTGRYVVNPDAGATPLRRDERSQRISDRAGAVAFAVLMVAAGSLAVYFGQIRPGDVPVEWLALTIAVGALSYFVADLWLRKK